MGAAEGAAEGSAVLVVTAVTVLGLAGGRVKVAHQGEAAWVEVSIFSSGTSFNLLKVKLK